MDEPVVMVHDYHLYTLPDLVRKAASRRLPPPLHPHPWTQSDAWRCCLPHPRGDLRGLLANDIIGFHTRSYRRKLPSVLPGPDGSRGGLRARVGALREREIWVRAYPLPIDHRATRQVAQSERVGEFEDELLRGAADFLILRVDRADLSKNVLRGFLRV